VWGKYLISWIYELHYKLLAGETGRTIVGIAGVVLLVSVTSGIYLWWPLFKNGPRAAFAIRRGKKNFDLHKTTGIVSSLLLLVIAFTGVYLALPWLIEPPVAAVAPTTPWPDDPQSSATSASTPSIDVDRAAAAAGAVFPGSRVWSVLLPQGPKASYSVWMRHEGDVRKSGGSSVVWIDQYTAEVLAVRDTRQGTAGDAFLAWQFPLHNGEAFGLVGRWIVFFTGLAPAVLYLTGCILWWRKHRSKRRQGRRQEAGGRSQATGLDSTSDSDN
jgi:uncharacterized iron-regulated membrane protein